ncbi:MAG: DUF4176 domain-containing protein [Bacilli bacterium]|nr:DUF4176 domain-containing protein [Bacilli bacterium]
MNNKILPIGSIIKMSNSDLYLMIYGYANSKKNIDGEYYDYFCCIYPAGINGKDSILVKKEKIEKIIFIGYQDSKFENFVELLEQQ